MFAAGLVPRTLRSPNCRLNKIVYGYHLYWYGPEIYQNYDLGLISTLSYFSYEINPATGAYKTVHNWMDTEVITQAQEAGCKVELCITNFGGDNNYKFFRYKGTWQRLASNVVKLLDARAANGVNIDFEHIRKSDKAYFIKFVQYLHNYFAQYRPGTTISVAVPSIDEDGIWDLNLLDPYVDLFVIMAYDYHYANSKTAGPVAPVNGGLFSIKTTLDHYTSYSVCRDKIVMAVPYYGREWQTQSGYVPSATTQHLQAATYAKIKQSYMGRYSQRWDANSASPFYIMGKKGNFKQCWHENEKSIAAKYNLAMQYGLGGVGIWALGYDNGHQELWDVIESKFMTCADANTYSSSGSNAFQSHGASINPFYQRIVDATKQIMPADKPKAAPAVATPNGKSAIYNGNK
ncbi:MAG: hypothetical protein IPN25_04740 [Sphingobacteriales bacterium]|nr:hypothetical protein [Sphingobacteriales bacterium]